MPTKINVNGITYKSVRAAALDLNLSPKKVQRRIREGWSIAEAFGHVDRTPIHYKEVIAFGVTYENLPAAIKALKCNVTPDLVRDRMRKMGWTLEEALKLDHKVRPHRYEVKLVHIKDRSCRLKFRSQNEAARAFRLNKNTVRNTLAKGVEPAEALKLKGYRSVKTKKNRNTKVIEKVKL